MLNARHAIALLVLVAAPVAAAKASDPVQAMAAGVGRSVPAPPEPEAPVPDSIPDHSELDPEFRAELEDLDLTVIRYHADPEQRFVILNGRRATEGLPAGRDLWIHEIRPKAVVMRYIDRFFLLRPR